MARRSWDLRDIVEIYEHWQDGRGLKAIARSLGIDRKTVRKYVRAAEAAGFSQSQKRSRDEWAAFVHESFPEVSNPLVRKALYAELGALEEQIREGLRTNRVTTVWRRLVDEAGLGVSLTTFRRYVRTVMPEALAKAPVPVWRPEVDPGEEVQIDFGSLGFWQNPVTGKKMKVWAFIMVLSFSRHMFVRPVTRLDSKNWLEAHVEGFEFFGGLPRRLVLDNLTSGVIKPDLYDPQFNRAYAELAAHYGVLIDPCRAGRPTDKPRVERQVPYVRESLWRGRTFTSLDQIRREAIRWCLEVAGQRVHGTTRQHPLDLFLEKERDTLRPLPERRWEAVAWTMAKVAPDSFCSVYGATYTVPWRFRGRDLSVRVGEKVVEFYLGEVLVKVQPRRHDRGRQIDPNDLPPDRIAFYQRTPQWCLRQAREAGPSVFEAVRQVLLVDTLTHLRQAQAILRQGGVYGLARLDAACRRALEFGDPSYRTIKRILKTGMDQVAADLPQRNHARSAKAYLRGKDTFALAGNRADTGEE